MNFSKRTDWNTQLNPLAQNAERLRSDADFINLTVSNPTECGFDYLQPSLLEPLMAYSGLRYTPDPRGLLHAREAVSRYYADKGILLHPDQIFLTASTSEAYSFVFKILAESGQAVTGPAPGYPLMDYLAEINDTRLVRYPLVYRSGWQIDRSEFKKQEKVCAALIVNPSNPAGNYTSEEEQSFLAQWAAQQQAALIADEVFYDFALQGPPPAPSFAAQNDVLTFTLSGISKILGLPQMKLSWIIVTGPEAVRQEAMQRLEIVADTYLSASTPIQNALPAWMEERLRIQKEITARIRTNRAFLETQLAGSRLEAMKAEGGWTSILKMPGPQTDEDWALELLQDQKILLHPGYLFDLAETTLVLSLITPEKLFQEGISRLQSAAG